MTVIRSGYHFYGLLGTTSLLQLQIRYFTLLVLSYESQFCQYFFFAQMGSCTIIIISADLILVLRVWILYGKSKRFLYFIIPLLAGLFPLLPGITIGLFTIKPLDSQLPVLAGCYSLKVPRLFTFYAVPSFLMAVVMFVMTLRKCGATILALGSGRTPVIALFLRDGVFWFLALVLVSIVEIILWDRARPTLAQIPVILVAVIGARIVLNLKYVASNADIAVATAAEPEPEQTSARRGRGERVPWYLKTTDTNSWGTHTV
ncbi:hypothetical protein DFH08DRAFT_832481 [Mycena albidolilacea]|uniref:Uncharacterized protein n=1 Tax=Mycena albidolilacea TaxID=1033008 RepID=A0AAD7F7M2_9AGAR|nr:hypothetical protein DFH08DRAFT_832481 [Mycena albidolilacea]